MTCEEHLTAMVEYLRGELEPLQKTRLESHLGHCSSCAAVRDRLAAGLEAARDWQPELEPEVLERRVARLAPYMEPRRSARTSLRLAWLTGGMALAALLVAVGLALSPESPTPAEEQVFDFSDGVAFDVGPSEPTLSRHQPTDHIRLIAPEDWDGSMVRQGRRTTIEMTRGFVAVSFAGGKSRRLRVRTPDLQVDVVGTRFVVDISGDITTVGVAEGRVRVRANDATASLSAGETRALENGALVVASAPACMRHLDDPYLTEHVVPKRSHARAGEPHATPEAAPVAISNVLDQLARAEELANDDQVAAAITIFASCADDPHPSYEPYRDLCRLQRARLLGFKQGRRDEARSLLGALSTGRGQVGREAALALCELDLEHDRCAARACLGEIANRGDESARREALDLMRRWRLEEVSCP